MEKLDSTKLEKLEEIFNSASKFTLATHTHPDGDAIGSTIALLNYLAAKGKDVVIAYSDSLGDNLKFIVNEEAEDKILFYNVEPEKVHERLDETEVIILMDANTFQRTSHMEEALMDAKATKVLIDHHLNPERMEFELIFSETETSSACEFLFYILMEMKDIDHDARKLPAATARALMSGMTTDTNNFANSTLPTTLEMASKLLEAGVDRDEILSQLYNQYKEDRVRLMGTFLKDLLHITDDGVAYAILDKKTQNQYHMGIGDTEGFVNIPLSIAKVRMSIFLKEDDGHYRVSIRSKKGTSANEVATRYFNGGGHECASGGKLIFGKDIEDKSYAAEYIEKVTSEYFSRQDV